MSEQAKVPASDSPEHRYEATIRLVVSASALDEAWRIVRAAQRNARLVEGVDHAIAPLVELAYSPDGVS